MSGTTFPDGFEIPRAVLAILERLEAEHYETWCVGGAIRDWLAGEPGHQDVDLATAAPPEEVQRLFPRHVPLGLAHGTIGVLDGEGGLHEVTTFRRDVQTDGRHAVVAFGVSLDEDLARRDFTINAIAYHPMRREWRDPFDGYGDLHRHVLRAVGDPATRFREDRLRILRALRFAARFALTIDPATWHAASAQAGDTGHLSAERVRDEWMKGVLTSRTVGALVDLWCRAGVAAVWMPELDCGRLPPPDSPGEILRDPVLVTAFVCSAAGPVWRRLKGSNSEIHRAEAIDRARAQPESADAVAVRRWLASVGDAADDLTRLARWREPGGARWTDVADAVRARGDATSRRQLAISGDDLIRAGIPAGPAIGRTLDRLLQAVLADPALNTRDRLLEWARTSPES